MGSAFNTLLRSAYCRGEHFDFRQPKVGKACIPVLVKENVRLFSPDQLCRVEDRWYILPL